LVEIIFISKLNYLQAELTKGKTIATVIQAVIPFSSEQLFSVDVAKMFIFSVIVWFFVIPVCVSHLCSCGPDKRSLLKDVS
jgi:hypothetical protein